MRLFGKILASFLLAGCWLGFLLGTVYADWSVVEKPSAQVSMLDEWGLWWMILWRLGALVILWRMSKALWR